jgi:hypothetical protein
MSLIKNIRMILRHLLMTKQLQNHSGIMIFKLSPNISKCFILLALIFFSCSQKEDESIIPLAGQWKFSPDPTDKGINEEWFQHKLQDSILLPGSMNERGKGTEPSLATIWTGSIYDSSWFFNPRLEKYRQPGNIKFPFWLTPLKYYVGPAWYQKEVDLPESWKGRLITLYLERPHWESTLWVDTIKLGMQNSLSTPHNYVLPSDIPPGKHTITIRIDNRIKEINVGPDSHSLTDHTQGNWNGIVGDIELKAGTAVVFGGIKLFPDIVNKQVKAIIAIDNPSDRPVFGNIELSARSFNSNHIQKQKSLTKDLRFNPGPDTFALEYPMGDDIQLWDEFNPALYMLTAVLTDLNGNTEIKQIQFGMREFKTNGTRFEINGRPVFLRGTVENCTFPHTGYPSTDPKDWERIFKICRNWGLNHMRFHSWCPPEAAFVAADKMGFYLHVEGPSWANHGTALGYGRPIDQYIYDETNRIVDTYGNHPSFCMMAYGNEPAGRNQVEYLTKFVSYWKAKDNRRVYTHASIGMSWALVPGIEYIVRSGPRGLPWDNPPETMFDYKSRIDKDTVPYVTHEMGQWCVFPDFREIPEYTGVYRAKNFELFQEDLADHYMGGQAKDFLMASGRLQVLCYKNEIEAGLRTPGLAGFQLLCLNDFPGQGSAIVGLVNVFWEEKGYIKSREFTTFCNQTVPLARFPKFVYKNTETFHASAEVFHFGNDTLMDVSPRWKISLYNGKPDKIKRISSGKKSGEGKRTIAEGQFESRNIPLGNCIQLGDIDFLLNDIKEPSKLNLEISIGKYSNSWDFWVYPAEPEALYKDEIYICDTLDTKAETLLRNGGKVLLLAAGKIEKGKDVVQYLKPVFWNTSWFRMRPPHTLGILCDPRHPLFREFPTEFHSNMQWWEILNRQQVMDLDDFPPDFRPLVQPIDTWFMNRRLGLIFEAKVGKGKLLVVSADLQHDLENRPAAKQLRFSIEKYMSSGRFHPRKKVEIDVIKGLFGRME